MAHYRMDGLSTEFLVCPHCIDERSQGATLSANPEFEAYKMRSGYFFHTINII